MACPTVGTLLSTTLMAGHKLANAWRCCLPLVKMRKAVSPLPLYGSREFQRKGFTFLPVIEQTTWLTLLSSIN